MGYKGSINGQMEACVKKRETGPGKTQGPEDTETYNLALLHSAFMTEIQLVSLFLSCES